MSNPQIVKSDKFSCSNVEYSDPKKLQHGGQAIYLNYDGKPLILQTPKMSMPWGMGKFDGDIPKYSVDLSFKGMDNSESLQSFYSALNQLDEKLVEDGVSNSMQWFKKKKQTKKLNEQKNGVHPPVPGGEKLWCGVLFLFWT